MSQKKATSRFTVNEKNSITDIEILLTEEEYQQMLRHFPQKDRHWQTSCYTYIVQSELAKYHSHQYDSSYSREVQVKINGFMTELRTCTEQYAVFESLINNPKSLSPTENLTSLLTTLQAHQAYLQNSALPSYIKFILAEQTKIFQKKIETINARIATKKECKQVFAIQDEDPGIPSIGAFIADQMWHLTHLGIENIYQITDGYQIHNTSKYKLWNRIKQVLLFKMHPAIKALSDAKANVEVKGRSLHGIRFNNSKVPVPPNMLKSLGPLPKKEENAEKQWTSLSPFVDNLNDLESLDEILSDVRELHSPLGTLQPPSAYQALVFGANIIELCIVLMTRVPYIVLSTALSLSLARPLEWLISLFTKEPFGFFSNQINKLDTLVADLHQEHSLVSRAKNARNQHYKFNNRILNALKSNSNSLYCSILNEFNSEILSSYIANGLRTLGRTIKTFYNDPTYMMVKAGIKASNKTVARYRQTIDRNFLSLLEKKLQTASDSSGQLEESAYKKREKIEAWKANTIEMPIDFFVEIFVGLPDSVIGPMFRKSPGAATFFFMLSNASLAALLAGPAAGQVGSVLSIPPAILSQLFTGKDVSNSFAAQVIAVFLQWKIGFFSSEAIASIIKGDYEFLKGLFQEPEKITLSLSILIAAGWAMRFIPEIPEHITIAGQSIPLKDIPLPFAVPILGNEIPNVYIYFINMFIEESKECAHGQVPANFLEYAFLSLKFGFLCEGFLSGSHKTLVTEIIADLKREILENKVSVLDLDCFQGILQKHHIHEEHELHEPLLDALLKAAKDNAKQTEEIRQNAQEASDNLLELPTESMDEDIEQIEDDLDRAKIKIVKAIQTVQKMHIVGEGFKSLTDARLYFDYLSRTFEDYNACQRARGHFDKELDDEYLHSFYNKYCYKGSNNFLRLISIIPFYPITKISQGLQKFLATYLFDSPSTLFKVAKSEAKNTVMMDQLFAMAGRITHELVRAYTYSFRALVVLTAVPLAAFASIVSLPILCIKMNPLTPGIWLMNTAIDIASKISPHRSRGLVGKTMETDYANAAHVASTNSEDLNFQHARLMKELFNYKTVKAGEEKEEEEKESPFHERLKEYNDIRKKRLYSSNSKRPDQLKRLSLVLSDPYIKDKSEKIKTIQAEMKGKSVLKETCSEMLRTGF